MGRFHQVVRVAQTNRGAVRIMAVFVTVRERTNSSNYEAKSFSIAAIAFSRPNCIYSIGRRLLLRCHQWAAHASDDLPSLPNPQPRMGELVLCAATTCRPPIRELTDHGSAVIDDDYVPEVCHALPRERVVQLNLLVADVAHPISNRSFGTRICVPAGPTYKPFVPE
jgi:hypothetical protein